MLTHALSVHLSTMLVASSSALSPAPHAHDGVLPASTLSVAQQEEGERRRLYDLRDLSRIFPETLENLVEALARLAGLHDDVAHLDFGVFVLTGESEAFQRFEAMLEELRALYTERYNVEVRASVVDLAKAPEIGAPAPEDAQTLMISRQTAIRRVPLPVTSQTTEAYVSDLQPIVGEAAVGYDPSVENASSGFEARLTLGAGAMEGELIPASISGTLSSTEVLAVRAPEGLNAPGGELQLHLPVRATRSFRGQGRIPLGRATTLGVVDGFEEGRVIVVSVRATRAR